MTAISFVMTIAGAAAAMVPVQPTQVVDNEDEITVTGERVPRSLKETASSVVVITDQEIDAQAADRVDLIMRPSRMCSLDRVPRLPQSAARIPPA